ncbi:hypothetical protein GIB67_020062 [Kingdonia uniflora]|uniref:Uncharacterized protein n=1 Tax=Kingdonia uniflora TaxID=39325 RepID=A0A7J7L273_9MAGN|nr:hypothetical protein GIB67_020062 [Kingdonia uniflora]
MVSSIIQRKLRKTKEKDSDHGRHMKAFNRSKVRDPEVQVMEDDLELVPQEEEGDSTEEVRQILLTKEKMEDMGLLSPKVAKLRS